MGPVLKAKGAGVQIRLRTRRSPRPRLIFAPFKSTRTTEPVRSLRPCHVTAEFQPACYSLLDHRRRGHAVGYRQDFI
jgi:hypothetical protein